MDAGRVGERVRLAGGGIFMGAGIVETTTSLVPAALCVRKIALGITDAVVGETRGAFGMAQLLIDPASGVLAASHRRRQECRIRLGAAKLRGDPAGVALHGI